MLRIRRMEEKCAELYGAGKIRGFLHLYIGEEACATGAMHALAADDNVVATYREHGHALLRGVGMDAIMAEMFGKAAGCSRGRGGSMHLFDARAASTAATPSSAAACRSPWAWRWRTGCKACAASPLCFFGEGAMAEGAFHESMNLAALWQLPVLFCCENNLYAMGTALARSESQTDLCAKAASYRHVATFRVDGMDVRAVFEAP
jgi:pyruvate dehydrogenase E1 component alpha subunit